MYETPDTHYCYPGTDVLRNLPGLRSQADLDKFEAVATAKRAEEPLPRGRLNSKHYRAIHRHLFQDIFSWAGRLRKIRITKGDSTFCYPEYIGKEMKRVFAWLEAENYLQDLPPEVFTTKAAHLLAELNAIHPFREGNGRVQNAFLYLLADRAGHPLDYDRLDAAKMMDAMIASFSGNEELLRELIMDIMRVRQSLE